MTVQHVPKEALLLLLEQQPADLVPTRCLDAVRADDRVVLQTGSTSAGSLRHDMQLKLAAAQRGGRPITGGDDLVSRLQELKEASIQVFGFETEHEVVAIYASMARQAVAGCLLFERT